MFEPTISNHGTQLFSRPFLSGAEADLFFNGTLVDLGSFAGGMQDLLISSTLNYSAAATPAAYEYFFKEQ